MSTRGKLLFPAAVLLLFLCAGVAYASGQKENQLATAQQLINQKKYNDAILVLTRVMRDHPRDFDRAQKLLAVIDKARRAYNEKLAELIKLFNEGNLEEAYTIIKELETLDRAPSERTLESQAYARQTATYVYETKQFQSLMNRALPLLESGNYAEAVSVYLSGFDIGRDLFEQANYGNIVSDKVMSIRDDIRQAATEYVAELHLLDAQRAALGSALSRPAALAPQVETIVSTLGHIEVLRKRIDRDSLNLKIQQESIVIQHNSQQSIPWIAFMDRIVHGRTNASTPEGIIAAIDDSWHGTLEGVTAELSSRASQTFARGRKSYDAEQWNRALEEFAAAKSYALVADQAAAAWGLRLSVGSSLTIAPEGWTSIDQHLPMAINNELLARVAGGYASLIAEAKVANQIATQAGSGNDSISQLTEQRRRVRKVAGAMQEIQTGWSAVKERYGGISSGKLDLSSGLSAVSGLVDATNLALAVTERTIIVLVAREGSIRLSPIPEKLATATSTVKKAITLMNGVPPKSTQGQVAAGLAERYPAQALGLLTEVQPKLQTYRRSVSGVSGFLTNQTTEIANSESVLAVLVTSRKLDSELASLEATARDYMIKAKQEVFQAERYRQEGEDRFQRAKNDIANQRLGAARQEIAAAASSLDTSLSYQESAAVRKLRNEEIPRLSEEIANAENIVVVREVRRYINRGRALYSQGNYPEAQDVFLQAQSRWMSTNTQPDPEINTWLKYVNTALTINSGRFVAPTDPLYPEITQVLNLAQKDYLQAKQLVAARKEEQAQALLSEVRTKLIYVQVPFPLNKKARVLSLKLLELTDPKHFRAIFSQKYDKAVADLKRNPQVGYIELKDLQAIAPDFPGLKDELNRAEILTGMRRPPPNPAKIKEAADLYRKAFAIVRQNVRAQFPIALSYLNRAIELDPNNEQAASLKDRISIDQGAGMTVVLSSGAQVRFKLAQEQFIAKNYYEALRTVTQLLKEPANRSYPPLLELKRRIESKI